MKKDGSLDKIIKKWTASSSSAVPTTTTLAGLKAIPVKAKYIIASDSSFAPFVSKIQATNTLVLIWN